MEGRYLLLNERNKHEVLTMLPQDSDVMKLADYFSNFSDSTRIKILSCLSLTDMCVNDLSKILGLNQTTVSHQLKILKDQKLVTYRREGKILVYSLTSSNINEMMMYAINVI